MRWCRGAWIPVIAMVPGSKRSWRWPSPLWSGRPAAHRQPFALGGLDIHAIQTYHMWYDEKAVRNDDIVGIRGKKTAL